MSLSARRRRKRLSLTSLIDVIFLLLLFFMLSSTFSRFAEVEIATGGGQSASAAPTSSLLFLRLGAEDMTLNGQPIAPEALAGALANVEDATLLISITRETTAQRLTDVLVIARNVPDLSVTVLEAS